jgi:serine/threonine protein kinase
MSSPESDVYQLGGVIYCAITLGSSPYKAMCDWESMGYSKSLLSAVSRCTQSDPHERPSSMDLPECIMALVQRVEMNLPRDSGLLIGGPGQEQGRGELGGLERMYGRI